MKKPVTKAEKKAHKQSRDNRKNARGKVWQAQ
jgi:hypothetical protein